MMEKPTRSFMMNTAIGVSVLALILVVSSNSFTEKHTQTTRTHDEPENAVQRTEGIRQNPTATHTQPQRVRIPVTIRPRIPDKGRAENSGTFLDRENKKFGTAMPIYKDIMIEMLKDESRDNTPGALSREDIKALEKKGDLIW